MTIGNNLHLPRRKWQLKGFFAETGRKIDEEANEKSRQSVRYW